MEKVKKKHTILKVVLAILLVVVILCVVLAVVGFKRAGSKGDGGYAYTDEIMELSDNSIGNVEVSTMPLENGTLLKRGSFTYSGRVVYTVKDGKNTSYYTCNDDGSDKVLLCTTEISGGNRLLPFYDNTRVLLGDYILECPDGQTLDTCEEGKAQLVPINFPKEFSEDDAVTDVWTEVIIAQDCKHFS